MIENPDKTIKREFLSFGGQCPVRCLHCYTYNEKFPIYPELSIDSLVESLNDKSFDIVYVSGYRENFLNPDEGLQLIENIFQKYQTDILITTRNVFNSSQINRLCSLNEQMRKAGKYLYVCISIPAYDSYKKIEPSTLIQTPQKRISFLKELFRKQIITILTLRPLFPAEFIPVSEVVKIIELCSSNTTAVISSGIVLDETILSKLKDFPSKFKFRKAPLMGCLKQFYDVLYVDVNHELKIVKSVCDKFNIPFFTNSIPMVVYIRKTL